MLQVVWECRGVTTPTTVSMNDNCVCEKPSDHHLIATMLFTSEAAQYEHSCARGCQEHLANSNHSILQQVNTAAAAKAISGHGTTCVDSI